MRLNSSNPALAAFDKPARWDELAVEKARANTMTVRGTVIATSMMFCVVVGAALLTWTNIVQPKIAAGDTTSLMLWSVGSGIGAFVLGLVGILASKTAPYVGFLFAGLKGVSVSCVSAFIMLRWFGNIDQSGLVFQAVTLTFGIFAAMLIAYGTGVIKASPMFIKIVSVGIIGVMLYGLALFLTSILGFGIPNLWASASPIGIGFSCLVVVLASLSLILDFEVVKRGVATGAPKRMEWVAGIGLIFSLVWLYIELLSLLAKLRSGD